jgi:hypothetical protein
MDDCEFCKDQLNSKNLVIQHEECEATIVYSAGIVRASDINGDYIEWEVDYCPVCGRKLTKEGD